MRKLLIILFLLTVPLEADAWNVHGVANPFPNATSPMGFNLDPVRYYDGQFVLTIFFNQANSGGTAVAVSTAISPTCRWTLTAGSRRHIAA